VREHSSAMERCGPHIFISLPCYGPLTPFGASGGVAMRTVLTLGRQELKPAALATAAVAKRAAMPATVRRSDRLLLV